MATKKKKKGKITKSGRAKLRTKARKQPRRKDGRFKKR